MNDSILVRAAWRAPLGRALLIFASVSAQSANAQMGARSQASIQIRVSVAPRFMTSNLASAEAGGIAINVASNAPGLRYKVIAQRLADRSGSLPMPNKEAKPAPSSTLLLIVPE